MRWELVRRGVMLLVLTGVLMPAPGFGAVILNQPLAAAPASFLSVTSGEQSADNLLFAGSDPVTVTGVTWYGSFDDSGRNSGDFEVRFFDDDESGLGFPDRDPIQTVDAGTQTGTGTGFFGLNQFGFLAEVLQFDFDFAAPLTLVPTDGLFLSIVGVDDPLDFGDDFFWSTSATGDSQDFFRSAEGAFWESSGLGVDFAFALRDDTAVAVPLPSTLALLLVGVLGLGALRRRTTN